jgi:hypothetical protein
VFEPSQEQSREFVQGGGLRRGQPIFEITPEPLEGIELGGRGGKKSKPTVVGKRKAVALCNAPLSSSSRGKVGGAVTAK